MTQQIASPAKKNKRILFVLLGLLIIGAAIAAYFIFRQPQAKNILPLVSINTPANGTTVEINVPFQVMAQAEVFPGAKRVEVYADGALIAVQDSSLANGGNPLVLSQPWAPLSLGRHALVARGYDLNGKFSDSSVVYVDVVELLTPTKKVNVNNIDHGPQITSPSIQQIADAAGISASDLEAANPGLGGTDPGAPLPPGTEINVPRTPAPAPTETGTPPLPMPGTPASPTNLTGTINCTVAQISWSASPDAANGYAVYRIGPTDGSPQRVGTLPSGTTTFSETISTPGTYRYQVAALHNGMEGLSVYFSGTTPDTCVPAHTNPDVISLVLNVTSITTTQPYDGVYCYFSFDQGSHLRIPASDFSSLAPDASGLNYDLQSQLPNRGQFVLSTHPSTQPVTLGGECWGRSGVESQELGSVAVSLPPAQWDGSDRVSTVFQNSKVASVGLGPTPPGTFSLHYRVGFESASTLRSFAPTFFGNIPDEELRPLLQIDPSLLAPYDLSANFGDIPLRCTPGSTGVVCRAAAGMRLSWKYDGNRSLIGYFLNQIAVTGSGAARSVGDPFELMSSDMIVYTNITRSDASAEAITDIYQVSAIENAIAQNCGTDNRLVYTVYVLNQNGDKVSSAETFLPMPACDTQVAKVEVTLNSVTFGPSSAHNAILDNDTCILCTDNRIEMIGYAGLAVGGRPQDAILWQGSDGRANAAQLFFEWPIWEAQGLVGDVCGAQAATCAYGPSATTTFQWSDLELQNATGFGSGHNKISMSVRDGHTATLRIEVYDIPTGIGGVDEPLCVATVAFPWNNAAEWQSVNEQQTVSQDHGEASCQITFTVQGSTP